MNTPIVITLHRVKNTRKHARFDVNTEWQNYQPNGSLYIPLEQAGNKQTITVTVND
jgi:hypothetical protein